MVGGQPINDVHELVELNMGLGHFQKMHVLCDVGFRFN